MKLLKSLAVILLSSAIFISCSGGAGKPEEVALKFGKAIQNLDFETAKKYSSKQTATLIDFMQGAMNLDDKGLNEAKEEMKGAKFDVSDSKISDDGNTAKVTIKVTNKDGEVKEEDIDLVKEDGTWKVALKM